MARNRANTSLRCNASFPLLLAMCLLSTGRGMTTILIALGVALLFAVIYGLWRFVLTTPLDRPWANVVWHMARVYAHAMHRVKAEGQHHVPSDGPVLIVSNHTAGVDPVLIQAVVPRVVRWMMTAKYHKWWLGWLWRATRPILVHFDERDSAAVREAIQLLRDGQIVGIFPEGGLNREREGLMEFGPGVAIIAKRSSATIVPVYISDTPAVDSPLLSFVIPSRSRVTFGEPFTFEKSDDRDRCIELIRQRITELAQQTGRADVDATGRSDDSDDVERDEASDAETNGDDADGDDERQPS